MADVEELGKSSDPFVGRVLGGRYRVTRPLGRGGMGVVYEAEHLLIGRKVALKTMTAHAALTPANVERFQREARAAALVGNSHVVDVLDMGELDAGSLYLVLEHLDGIDLGFAVASAQRFPVARALDIACQLCDALSAVHAAGILHRDLKPENIFLIERDGRPDFVKVLDFGICRFLDPESARLTTSGNMIGTPQFMAPEQVEGRVDLDVRTDIHALGSILFFVLSGRAPFVATSLPKLLLQISSQPPPSLRDFNPSLPSEFDAVIRRALDKNPEGRFDSCDELKAALLAASGGAVTLQSADALRFSAPAADSGGEITGVPLSKGYVRTMAFDGVGLGISVVLGLAVLQETRPKRAVSATESAEAPAPASPASRGSQTSAPLVVPSPLPLEPLTAESAHEPASSAAPAKTRSENVPAAPARAASTRPATRSPPVEASAASQNPPPPAGAKALEPDAGSATDARPAPSSDQLHLNRELKRGL
jgi:serine/threonine-protein kinase